MSLKRSRVRLMWKFIIGVIILFSGIISGLILLDMSLDIRNQAYEEEGMETTFADVFVGPVEDKSAVIGWNLIGLSMPVRLEYQNETSDDVFSIVIKSTQTEVTITNLEPHQRYRFRFVDQETNRPLSGSYQFSTRKK